MNDKELIGAVYSAMYQQCQRRGYAAPVDVLMDIGVLPKKKYEEWRFGRVSYLESVCTVNLCKLSFIMHQMRVYAQKTGLKPSFCYYKQWGVKKKTNRTKHQHFGAVLTAAPFSLPGKEENAHGNYTDYAAAHRQGPHGGQGDQRHH